MISREAGAPETRIGIPRSVLALMAGTLAVKLFLIARYQGFLTGDDLEVVQTAAHYAMGVTYQPWDIRCLFLPLCIVAPVLKLATLFGVGDPVAVTAAAALPSALFSTGAIAGVFALARRFGATVSTAAAAAWLYALHPLPLAYGSTCFPRPVSAALLVAAFLLASDPLRRGTWLLSAGLLCGAAFAVRWSEGVVLVPLLAACVARERALRGALLVLSGFVAATVLCVGAVDLGTYGSPFHSLRAFFRTMYFEISPDRLAREAPFPEYFRTCLRWGGPLLILLALASWKKRSARAPLGIGISIVFLLSLFAHKEERYLQSAIPFLSISAAFGWEWLRDGGHRALAAAALLLALPWGLVRSVAVLRYRSGSGIEAARYLRALDPRPRVLAFEQMWAYGEHLYLGNDVEIREIEYHRPLRPRAIAESARGADAVGVYSLDLDRAALEELRRLGFRRVRTFRASPAYECALYARSAPRQP